MPTLSIVNFNIVCATLGGFITLFGLISYLVKEKFYLSEALISVIAGIIFSPHATNWIRPLDYAQGNEIDLETITLYFTRLVLGVQLVLAGVQLPSRYLRLEWKSLSLLLGPGMCCMWISTALLVWGLVPNIPFLYALAVGACVTPTDPILSNSIVKGKFADKNIPRELQKIIVAESGSNDGLGYPFLFLPLYLIKYTHDGGAGQTGGAGKAIGYWFGETWGYEILLSVVYGAVVGWIAKELLHWAEERKYVDRESFLVFAITLALFILGTCGMIGTDDVLACFIAGNVFTWDDWFRLETLDDSLQPTIDMLLNVAIFIWFGAVCPWYSFVHNNVIPIYRLIPLGILVLLFRRLPIVLLLHKKIHQIEEFRQALFVGFFGPIGVSAIFYLYVTTEFLRDVEVDGVQREDAATVTEIVTVVVWFLVMCSVVVHGISIPLGKLGFYLPRTISAAISSDRVSFGRQYQTSTDNVNGAQNDDDEPDFHPARAVANEERVVARHLRSHSTQSSGEPTTLSFFPNWMLRFPRIVKRDINRAEHEDSHAASRGSDMTHISTSNISSPSDPRPLGRSVRPHPSRGVSKEDPDGVQTPTTRTTQGTQMPSNTAPAWNRTIRFGDEGSATEDGKGGKSRDQSRQRRE